MSHKAASREKYSYLVFRSLSLSILSLFLLPATPAAQGYLEAIPAHFRTCMATDTGLLAEIATRSPVPGAQECSVPFERHFSVSSKIRVRENSHFMGLTI